jgi:hypothetical protein
LNPKNKLAGGEGGRNEHDECLDLLPNIGGEWQPITAEQQTRATPLKGKYS